MKIYCCHPITGSSADEVYEYYDDILNVMSSYGYEVLLPLYAKNYLRTETNFRAADYRHPVSTNHAIFNRDRWMVDQSDIVYANLMGSERVSIGTMMELAWASDKGKHVIVAMDKENVHRHAFVLEAADVIFDVEKDALEYLENMAKRQM